MVLEDYKDFVAAIATIVTIIQFLSGIEICFKISKQGSTGDISGFPFVGGVFSTTMWLTYGWLLQDRSMTVTNGVGLFLQASTIDGRRKGACLFCQEYFMDLYLLAELKTISLKVTTVDMLKPPPDFRSNFEATPPPILIDNGLAVLENDKIERHIMKNIPGGHNLFVQDKDVAQRTENVYSKFKLMLLKRDEAPKNTLLAHLRKINDHLRERGTRFLTGDTMCCFDCELMPKLQHIRVAGKYFADFEIPAELEHLWRYMYHMYQLDAFTQSCPADQDIINHYKQQQGTRMKKHEELETPTFTTSIPASVNP